MGMSAPIDGRPGWTEAAQMRASYRDEVEELMDAVDQNNVSAAMWPQLDLYC